MSSWIPQTPKIPHIGERRGSWGWLREGEREGSRGSRGKLESLRRGVEVVDGVGRKKREEEDESVWISEIGVLKAIRYQISNLRAKKLEKLPSLGS